MKKRAHKRTDTAAVFGRVKARLEAEDAARSLWQKLQEEIGSAGVSSAITYLRGRFTELSGRVGAALPHEGGD